MAQSVKKLGTVIVGCGNIANSYAEQIKAYSNIELLGFCDVAPDRAETFASKFGGKAYARLEDVLTDAAVELIVNLTIHHAHAEVIGKCLEAGKHVHSEKPLTMCYAEAEKLVALARRKGLRLSGAPSTFLGEAAQTCAGLLRQGKLGTVRLTYAEMNHGRIESWHPNPAPFYQVGPVWDIAVYPLGIWAAFFGPMRKVTATGHILMPERQARDGSPFTITSPNYVTASIEFECGLVARLTVNFYVTTSKQAGMMEFHGDAGSLYLGNNHVFNAPVELSLAGGEYKPVALVRPGFEGIEFARGVEELADAIISERPHRCNAGMAAHVVEVIEAIHASIEKEEPVTVTSSFTRPDLMPWTLASAPDASIPSSVCSDPKKD